MIYVVAFLVIDILLCYPRFHAAHFFTSNVAYTHMILFYIYIQFYYIQIHD